MSLDHSIAASPRVADLTRSRWRWQIATPAWLVSMVVHALLVIVLGYVASQQLHGTNAPAGAVLIASYTTTQADEDYFDDEKPVQIVGAADAGKADSPELEQDAAEAAQSGMAAIAKGPPPVDIEAALPSTALAAANPGESMPGTAAGIGHLPGVARRPPGVRGRMAKTHVYGIPGEGNTFVYVFDRSASMGVGANSLLASAKRELLASLDDLGEENRFQIIFYNKKATAMNLGRGFAGLVFADDRAKELARRFVGGIDADGGTEHYDALLMALHLAPDVIFFLTDADEPE
ncbi:MAG: hypothetical protein ACREHD_06310, partial [Pirellulales bacterium]